MAFVSYLTWQLRLHNHMTACLWKS